MVFWYAYQMDLQVNGQGKTTIATPCEGTASDKSCNFNEFLKHISPDSPGTTTSIMDTDLDPDVDKGAQALLSSGYDFVVNQHNFLPSKDRAGQRELQEIQCGLRRSGRCD